jgi:hypothetical protein
MTDAEATVSPYHYSTQQLEVIRLHDRYRRCLMDQKYYAWKLARYQRWDTASNVFAGITMVFSLVTRPSDGWLSIACYVTGILAAIVFISKPILKIGEKIEKYTTLQIGFGDSFNRIETLVADIRNTGRVSADHRTRAHEIFERCAALALREDADIDWKKVERFKAEVEKAIPEDTLWLPQK